MTRRRPPCKFLLDTHCQFKCYTEWTQRNYFNVQYYKSDQLYRSKEKHSTGGGNESAADAAKAKARARNAKRKRPPRNRKAKRAAAGEQRPEETRASSPLRTPTSERSSSERHESSFQKELCSSPQQQQQLLTSPNQTQSTAPAMANAFISSTSANLRNGPVPVNTAHGPSPATLHPLLTGAHIFDAASSGATLPVAVPIQLPMPQLSQHHQMFELSGYPPMQFDLGPNPFLVGPGGVSGGTALLDFGQPSASAVAMHDAMHVLQSPSSAVLQARDTNSTMYFSHM